MESRLEWSSPTVQLGPRCRVKSLPDGLYYCRDFISVEEEKEITKTLDAGEWWTHLSARAQQFFGLVYYQTHHNVAELQPSGGNQQGRPFTELPEWLMPRVGKAGIFESLDEINQVAANDYRNNVGISLHVEDPKSFGPNLATLSLLSPVEMTLVPEDMKTTPSGIDHGDWLKILLEPRSLLVMQREARYNYQHGIRRSLWVALPDGGHVRRGEDYRRISLTFRELLETRRQLQAGPSVSSDKENEQSSTQVQKWHERVNKKQVSKSTPGCQDERKLH